MGTGGGRAELRRVPGTAAHRALIEVAAGIRSFRPRDTAAEPARQDDDPGNPTVDFKGERLRNETHRSTTDPEACLMRKGKGREAKPRYMGHALMEHRHGLIADFAVTPATGTAERDTVPVFLAADKGYDHAGACPPCGRSK